MGATVYLRLSMAKIVRLWTELASLSRGLAVLMTPLRASTLKKRSKSVFLSMEYLDTNTEPDRTNEYLEKRTLAVIWHFSISFVAFV